MESCIVGFYKFVLLHSRLFALLIQNYLSNFLLLAQNQLSESLRMGIVVHSWSSVLLTQIKEILVSSAADQIFPSMLCL